MPDSTQFTIPEILPAFVLKDQVAFPYMVFPLYLKRDERLPFEKALQFDSLIALFTHRDDAAEEHDGFHGIGTVCKVSQIVMLPDDEAKVMLEGQLRIRLKTVIQESPFLLARVEPVREFFEKTMVSDALIHSLNGLLKIALSYGRPLPDDVMKMIDFIDSPAHLSDLVALYIPLSTDERQQLLETIDPLERLKKVYIHLTTEVKRLQVKGEVAQEVNRRVEKTQKEYLLREQMKHIKEELGEDEAKGADLADLRKKLDEAGLPDEVGKVADKELKRLERINPLSPEHTVSRTYLEYLAGMPWQNSTPDNRDINQAESVLDEDHYDLTKVKERILEYLAVRSLKEKMKGPILCFVGPPGVGKTSLGRSIARALGRKFIRVSFGGMRDEAEIRGHRRTYIGAMPGRIIQEISRCGSNNPVFMLDEVDKIGLDFRGDPASALLEVLDPEQNYSFTDHYLDVPFDLSNVMFITTANQIDPIPAPLRDRMEVISLSGYTDEEKEQISFRYLIDRETAENGLTETPPRFTREAVHRIIRDYTREAGVRNLQRNIAAVCRKLAKEITQGKPLRTEITPEIVTGFLGHRKFFDEISSGRDRVGVATGLAWTEAGGDIIFIEAGRMAGKGDLILTGSLGEVMKESARAALSFIRSNSAGFGIQPEQFATFDLHIHVPAGSIPKDGPSAGVAMMTALVSLLSGRLVRRDVAMTGEISLTGRVLPIGGLKEKVLAARRAGIKTVLLPERNRPDLDDVPDHVREEMTFIFLDDARDALQHTLSEEGTARDQ